MRLRTAVRIVLDILQQCENDLASLKKGETNSDTSMVSVMRNCQRV